MTDEVLLIQLIVDIVAFNNFETDANVNQILKTIFASLFG